MSNFLKVPFGLFHGEPISVKVVFGRQVPRKPRPAGEGKGYNKMTFHFREASASGRRASQCAIGLHPEKELAPKPEDQGIEGRKNPPFFDGERKGRD